MCLFYLPSDDELRYRWEPKMRNKREKEKRRQEEFLHLEGFNGSAALGGFLLAYSWTELSF
jgi:hypothetical protein